MISRFGAWNTLLTWISSSLSNPLILHSDIFSLNLYDPLLCIGKKTCTMAMSIWSSILSIANHTLVILIWRCNFPLNDNNRTPQLSLLVISNSKDNCWKGHQFQNNQHTLVQCCPCFRQQVPLKRAPGVSPSVIVVLVSDNSWPIIKLCRNKIFPNGAQGHYFKGGVRADQSENSRSFNHQIFH